MRSQLKLALVIQENIEKKQVLTGHNSLNVLTALERVTGKLEKYCEAETYLKRACLGLERVHGRDCVEACEQRDLLARALGRPGPGPRPAGDGACQRRGT